MKELFLFFFGWFGRLVWFGDFNGGFNIEKFKNRDGKLVFFKGLKNEIDSYIYDTIFK